MGSGEGRVYCTLPLPQGREVVSDRSSAQGKLVQSSPETEVIDVQEKTDINKKKNQTIKGQIWQPKYKTTNDNGNQRTKN